MTSLFQVRVPARVLSHSAGVGAAIAFGLGAAYIAVEAVEHHAQNARSQRLADAAAVGFSESALGDRMAPGALAIARRHDPYTVAGDDARDREASLFAARLERGAAVKAKAVERVGPAARPFQLPNALDSSRELECLTQAVYFEARGEGPSGQAAVAQVVLNRVRHPAFPKTVCGVVFQGASTRTAQFSFTNDGSLRRSREPGAWRRAQKIAARALDGHVVAELGAATHFHAARVSPGWGGLVRVAAVGQHVFYRSGGRNGAPSAFPQRSRPEREPRTILASMLPTAPIPFKALAAGGHPAPAETFEVDDAGAEPLTKANSAKAPAKAAETRPSPGPTAKPPHEAPAPATEESPAA